MKIPFILSICAKFHRYVHIKHVSLNNCCNFCVFNSTFASLIQQKQSVQIRQCNCSTFWGTEVITPYRSRSVYPTAQLFSSAFPGGGGRILAQFVWAIHRRHRAICKMLLANLLKSTVLPVLAVTEGLHDSISRRGPAGWESREAPGSEAVGHSM